jgi:hypothetical protein
MAQSMPSAPPPPPAAPVDPGYAQQAPVDPGYAQQAQVDPGYAPQGAPMPPQQPMMGQQGYPYDPGMGQPGYPGQPQQWGVQPPVPKPDGVGTLFDLSFTKLATPHILKVSFIAVLALAVAEWIFLIIAGFQWGPAYAVFHASLKSSSRPDGDYTMGILGIVLGWIPGMVHVLLTRVFLEVANKYLTSQH